MTPSPTNSAIAAAAKEIVGGLGAYAEAFQLDWPPNRESYTLAVSDIILRHVEPIVRAVEAEKIDGCTGREWMRMCGEAEIKQDQLQQDCERLADRVKKQADEIAALKADPKAEQARASVASLTQTVVDVKAERDTALRRVAEVEGLLAAAERERGELGVALAECRQSVEYVRDNADDSVSCDKIEAADNLLDKIDLYLSRRRDGGQS